MVLIEWKPYPLSEKGFYGSPLACRNLLGDSLEGRAMAAEHPARNPTKYLAPDPRTFPAMAGQKQRQYREHPSRRLARQLALRWT
jgi:hypothetical protein